MITRGGFHSAKQQNETISIVRKYVRKYEHSSMTGTKPDAWNWRIIIDPYLWTVLFILGRYEVCYDILNHLGNLKIQLH